MHGKVFIGLQIKCSNRRIELTFLFLFLPAEYLLSGPQMEEENNKMFSDGRLFWNIRNPEISLRELKITGRNLVLLQSLVKRLLPLCEIDKLMNIYIYIYIYIYKMYMVVYIKAFISVSQFFKVSYNVRDFQRSHF